MGLLRAETLLRIKIAIKAGQGATATYFALRKIGKVTRKTDFLADFRMEAGIKKKEGLMRFVRKDRYPTSTAMAGLSKDASKEFLYKLKYRQVIRPGEPAEDMFVNLMSDVPLTPEMLEAEVVKQWGEMERYRPQSLTGLQVYSVFRKGIE